jgi:hypothetical protein
MHRAGHADGQHGVAGRRRLRGGAVRRHLVPDRVTVGCFAGDLPSDVWLRCRDRYRDHVTIDRVWPLPDRVCADEWANANPTHGFQECQALVRACLAGTGRACQAAAVVE